MNCVARENEGMNAGFNTRAVHAGRADLTDLGVHALPIDLSTTNPLPDIDAGGASYEQLASGGGVPEGGSAVYVGGWEPPWGIVLVVDPLAALMLVITSITLLGVLLITIVGSSLVLVGIPTAWQQLFIGLFVLFGVGVPALRERRNERRRGMVVSE